MEVNAYIATIWIAFEGQDLARRITILRVKCCSLSDLTPLAMSEVVSHIASFHVWKFKGRPWILLKVALYDAS